MRTIAGSFALSLVLAGCGTQPPDRTVPRPAESPGAIWVVRDTMIADRYLASGVAEPVQRATLASKLMARVTEVLVNEGDRVIAGQVLARLDATDLAARSDQVAAGLAAADAGYREAQTHAGRIRALFADSAAPRAQLDQAEAGLARAEAAVRQARGADRELDAVSTYAVIRAPSRGVVTQRLVDPGALAAPGQPLLAVEDPATLRVTVTASPESVRQIRRGQRLGATIAGEAVEAVVEGVVPAPGGNLAKVNALVPNPTGRWFSGSSATLALPQGVRTAVMIPLAAVIREGDLTGVRVRRGASSELRWVRLGVTAGSLIEVVSGLMAGDTIVIPAGTGDN